MSVSRTVFAVLLGVAVLAAVGCGDDLEVPSEVAGREPAALTRLAVTAEPGDDRAIFFSDKAGTYYYDAVAGEQTDPAMGFIAGGFRMVDGWRWWLVDDSVGVGPRDITGGVVRPDFAARAYHQADEAGFFERLLRTIQGESLSELTETITLADGALLVEVADSLGTVELIPAFSDRRAASDYSTQRQGDVLVVARNDYPEPRADSPRPVWLAVAGTDGSVVIGSEQLDALGARDRGIALGRVRFGTPGAVAFATGNTAAEAAANARRALERREALLAQRAQRLVRVLGGSTIRTEDEAFNRAFDWARLSLDALVVEDSARINLVSGIPGTEMPRGRSTLAALDGAFLATGEWERARRLLTTFGRAQRRDRRIDLFGRIPNEFAEGRPVYTTVDATPVFVAAVGDYLRATGDRSLITGNGAEFWTRTVYAVRGLEDIRTPDGFLRNAAGQTWVQPYDGRGRVTRTNRAVEVQGRYYDAFRAMQPIARIMGQLSGRPTSVQAYGDSAAALQRRFERTFVQGDRLADVIQPNDQPSPQLRPSGLLALRSFDLDAETRRRVLRRTASGLAYPYGVATLPQTDSLFYPYLNAPDFYEPAAARYDGTIWTWLAGPLVSLLVDEGAAAQAYDQTEALQRLILDRGVVGAAAENLDAHPRRADEEGEEPAAEPDLGGSPVQPWTLAEFVRNAYQDYAGVRYRNGTTVVLEPHLPAAWGTTEVRFRLGDGSVVARMTQRAGELAVGLQPAGRLPRGATVRVHAFGQVKAVPVARAQGDTLVAPMDAISVTITADAVTLDGERVAADSSYAVPEAGRWADFAWATPEIPDEYPVMRQVLRARELDEDQISRTNPLAVPILTRTDPDGDDWGATAMYTYPSRFPRGVLDISYVELTRDDSTTYFRIEMANVVSAEELGFQPAFLAIVLDTGEGGKAEVERNARYRFQRTGGYEYVVFVGDGLLIEDAQGRVLGEFQDVGDALFSVEDSAITFSVPQFVLPSLPRGTNMTVLAGARDESGGVGRFRDVRERGDANFGGGKINPRDPNIYDVLNARVER